jgi:hypothetical protein
VGDGSLLNSFLSDFINGLQDYFNPMLKAMEELLRTAEKKDKK